MRICILKEKNKLIEMQSSSREGTLIQNAINSGYNIKDIEEKEITQEEWVNTYKPKTIKPNTLKSKLIDSKIREIAIAELKKEGKLDSEGNVV